MQQARPTHPSSLQQAIAEVRRFLQRDSQIRTVIFRNAVFNLFIAFIPTLLPTFGLNVLKISSGQPGVLFTALGLGSIVAGVFPVPFLQKRLSANAITAVACGLLILVFYLIGFVRQTPRFLAVAALAGSAWTLASTEIWALGQRVTPDTARGRISAALMMSGSGALALGGVTWASLAATAGLENAVHFACIGLLLSRPFLSWWSPDTDPARDQANGQAQQP